MLHCYLPSLDASIYFQKQMSAVQRRRQIAISHWYQQNQANEENV